MDLKTHLNFEGSENANKNRHKIDSENAAIAKISVCIKYNS